VTAIPVSGRWCRAALATALALALGACSSAEYYLQLARGQYQLLSSREPIAAIVSDPGRDPQLRTRLTRVQHARRYAVDALHLPDNDSYTVYADVHRDYVVWNVFATPAYSLDAVENCFPIAGCLSYRGFYDERAARDHAAQLAARGYDTEVGGVAAYSTLGWFDDPVINTMMRWSDAHLIGTLFHELAHQRLFVKNDTAFNESFASFVEQQGLQQYAASGAIDLQGQAEQAARESAFVALILQTRQQLAASYRSSRDPAALAAIKQQAFEQLQARYRQLRDAQWNGYAGYDRFFERPLNNARLLPFGLYDQWVPAFATLFAEHGRDWAAFYAAAAELGKLAPAARQAQLQALAARASAKTAAVVP